MPSNYQADYDELHIQEEDRMEEPKAEREERERSKTANILVIYTGGKFLF
jgi:hypothetical protein